MKSNARSRADTKRAQYDASPANVIDFTSPERKLVRLAFALEADGSLVSKVDTGENRSQLIALYYLVREEAEQKLKELTDAALQSRHN